MTTGSGDAFRDDKRRGSELDKVSNFLMTLLTVQPLQNSSTDDGRQAEVKQFQVPADEDMPVSDLYDIIFSLTDIPPDQLFLKYGSRSFILSEFPSAETTTLGDAGIRAPATIEFSSIAEQQAEEEKKGDSLSGGEGEQSERERKNQAERKETDGNSKGADNDEDSRSGTNLNTEGNGQDQSKSTVSNRSTPSANAQIQSQIHTTAVPERTTTIDKRRLNADMRTALTRLQLENSVQIRNELNSQLIKRLEMYHQQMLLLEGEKKQAMALRVMPSGSDLEGRIGEIRGEEGNGQLSERLLLVKAILRWFKRDFFRWVDKPSCWACPSTGGVEDKRAVSLLGVEGPTKAEMQNGKATRVEVYGCRRCSAIMRFPRYEDAGYLVSVSRKGRCGEWAKAFTLCMRALGVDARMVHDWTDHVWTEVWCDEARRWIHADSCEESLDQPLLYEAGWGKKLNYAIATSRNTVIDVTARYSDNMPTVRERRAAHLEVPLATALARWNDRLRGAIADDKERRHIAMQWQCDIMDRDRLSRRHVQQKETTADEEAVGRETLSGRQSGSAEWVRARGEDGSGSGSSSEKR